MPPFPGHSRVAGVSWTWRSLPAGMLPRDHTARILFAACIACAALHAQVAITGRVVDENGAAVGGARVEWRTADGGMVTASSDQAGNFRASLPAEGEYALRVEPPGFFVLSQHPESFQTRPQTMAHPPKPPAGIRHKID